MTQPKVTIDFETTGKDAILAHPIEFAWQNVDPPHDFGFGFIRPPDGVSIPPETSAIHHIISEDVEDAPTWGMARAKLVRDIWSANLILIAHNAEFEQTILRDSPLQKGGANGGWICTYKCSLIAWPAAPSHSNEALRYWLELGNNRGRACSQHAHSALHDAQVTALLFNELHKVFDIAEMLRISGLPAELPTCPIGEYRGLPWAEVDAGFLRWMVNKPIDREDAIYCAKRELERRGKR